MICTASATKLGQVLSSVEVRFSFPSIVAILTFCFLGFCRILQSDSSPRACNIAADLTKDQQDKRGLKNSPKARFPIHPAILPILYTGRDNGVTAVRKSETLFAVDLPVTRT